MNSQLITKQLFYNFVQTDSKIHSRVPTDGIPLWKHLYHHKLFVWISYRSIWKSACQFFVFFFKIHFGSIKISWNYIDL